MMISKTSLDTIKAMGELAKLAPGKTEGVVRIAKKIGAPQNYLGKTLQRLVKEGLVDSQRGLNGGFCLTKPAKEISLYDVVRILEDYGRWETCFLGQNKCCGNPPCSMHHRWGSVRKSYTEFLKKTTIADI